MINTSRGMKQRRGNAVPVPRPRGRRLAPPGQQVSTAGRRAAAKNVEKSSRPCGRARHNGADAHSRRRRLMTVLILGGTDDEHAVYMLESLRGRGADAELLDSRWFPGELRLAHEPARGTWTLRLPDGRSLNAEQIRSVYWRCYNGVGQPALPDPEQAYIAGNDARSLFESLLIRLPVRWVNGWR